MPLYHHPSSMASTTSHHQLYNSNYTFTNTDHYLSEFPTSGLASFSGNNGYGTSVINMDNNNSTMWGIQDGFIPNVLIDNGALDHVVPLLDCDAISSSAWMPNFCDQLGGVSVSDLAIPSNVSDCKMGFYGGGGISTTGFQNFSSRSYQPPPHIGEFGEECCGFVEDIKPPAYPNTATENWGIQGNQIATAEEPNIKVGRYSEEERKERILRYLKKRNQRNFNKTIKYACRKTLADRRVRVRGRFARNNELCEEDTATKKHDIHHQKDDFYGGDSFQFQLKNDEEDWLQEAMASLVYLSNSSPDDM